MAEQLLNIKFVSEVEKHPCLYNYNLKEYSKKDITEKSWVAVGNAVNLTGLQAKEKWKNLRSVFVRNLKPPASGSSKKKKYYLTDAMQFALPYIKSAGIPSGSLPNLNNQDDEPQASTPPPISPPPLASPPPSVSPPPPTSPTASSSHQTDRTSTPLSISSQRQRRKNKISENDELFNDYLKTKLSKQNDVNNESTNNNANKMFLLSLLPDLNCMTSTQIRSFKRQVIDVIDNILNVPHTSPTQTPILLNIPNTSSASSSQITTGIEMPNNNMIQCTTNDGLKFH